MTDGPAARVGEILSLPFSRPRERSAVLEHPEYLTYRHRIMDFLEHHARGHDILVALHDATDKRVFDTVVVITDRRVLDQQLQDTIYQFEHKRGVVQKIDENTQQLAKALAELRHTRPQAQALEEIHTEKSVL